MPNPNPGVIAELSEDRAAEERRRAPRHDSDLQTTCRPLTAPDATSWPARVLNVSQNGIALVLSRRFERGALLTMELEDAKQTFRRSVFARVIHVHPQGNDGWRIGCAFTGNLSDEELEAFQAQRMPTEAPDSRAWVRFECDVATTFREADVSGGQPMPGRILNIAPGGIGLLAATSVPKGTLLWLQFPETTRRPVRNILVRVAQPGRPVDDEWLLGCEFAFQIEEQDLQGLLG